MTSTNRRAFLKKTAMSTAGLTLPTTNDISLGGSQSPESDGSETIRRNKGLRIQQVEIKDLFWKSRLDRNHKTSIFHQWE